jgi:hypothetical protein
MIGVGAAGRAVPGSFPFPEEEQMPDNSRIRELVQRAVTDPAFGQSILAHPETAAGEYNLTIEQVRFIQQLSEEGVLVPDVEAHMTDLTMY